MFRVRGAAPVRALEPITLAVAENDFITILGPPAAGNRPSCASLRASTARPSGRVLLDRREIRGPGADRGMVFQSYTLFPWLTVAENIAYGLREKGVPGE